MAVRSNDTIEKFVYLCDELLIRLSETKEPHHRIGHLAYVLAPIKNVCEELKVECPFQIQIAGVQTFFVFRGTPLEQFWCRIDVSEDVSESYLSEVSKVIDSWKRYVQGPLFSPCDADPKQENSNKGKQRPCYDRDHQWLEWCQEGLTPAKIRDRWNKENPDQSIAKGEHGRDVVKKGLKAAENELKSTGEI